MMEHPKTIEDITAPWVTEVLRGAGVLRQSAVRAIDVRPVGQGVGFLSNRARVTLTSDPAEEEVPATVVIKMPATLKEGAEFAQSTHVYEREIRFYREVAPRTSIHLGITPARFREAWPQFLDEYGDSLPAGGRALGECVNRRLEAIVAKFLTGSRTLVHFDYRADNLFFDELTRKNPVVVLDWQLVMWGPGTYDLARLVCARLPPAERGGHHEELVECWWC
jgi:hypothetical protein